MGQKEGNVWMNTCREIHCYYRDALNIWPKKLRQKEHFALGNKLKDWVTYHTIYNYNNYIFDDYQITFRLFNLCNGDKSCKINDQTFIFVLILANNKINNQFGASLLANFPLSFFRCLKGPNTFIRHHIVIVSVCLYRVYVTDVWAFWNQVYSTIQYCLSVA